MTDRHIHYVGPFVHNGSFAEAVVRRDSGLARPKLRHALNIGEVEVWRRDSAPTPRRVTDGGSGLRTAYLLWMRFTTTPRNSAFCGRSWRSSTVTS